jgi:hypothetical protein
MKTLIAILTAASVLTLGAQRASAHDGWSTTGKVLTGLVIGGAVASALAPPPPTVVYTAPPVVYTPAPAVAYTPAPAVTYAPAPAVTYAPAPVVVAPAPVVVYSAPVYRPYPYYRYPGPVVSFRFGIGGGHYYHHGHR